MNTLSEKLNHMSEFLSSQDLVDLGIYKSTDAAYLARIRSNSPAFIKLKHKILYPKQEVLEFLEKRLHSGKGIAISSSATSSQENQ
jgi:hypothetical protein